MRMVFLGAPGSGKGTQSALLIDHYGIPQISTGDMLRTAISEGTPLGQEAHRYVREGNLVPDEVIIGLVRERLSRPDTSAGFILDGFPRSIPQAVGLDAMLKARHEKLDRVIKVSVSRKVLLDRLTSRRVCPGCGAVYNLDTHQPKEEGICTRCDRPLVQRDDDKEETVRRRLVVHEEATKPLMDYYDAQGLLAMVDGEGTQEEVFERIREALEGNPEGNGSGTPS